MNSVLERIEQLSDSGNATASAIYKETFGMSDKELALYLGDDANADKVAKLLGVQHLVTKDANQALAKDFYELRNRGRQMVNPDRGQMLDVYNEKLKDVPYYMEKFGLPTEQGKYRVEDQIQFVKNIDRLDPVELQNLANQEGFATADQMRNEIKRTGERLIGDIVRKGLNPETGGTTLKSVLRSAASLAAPRIVEAQEMGQDPSWKDVVGDEIELGLNFVPGMSAVSKGARALSKFNRLKNLPNSALARVAGGAAEMVAAPGGSQLYDAAVYDNEDPRGQLDWKRFTAQAAGGLAGFGTLKALGAQGKNILEGSAGKSGANNVAKSLMDVAENIGNDARENIARRQLAMERKAEMAKSPEYYSDIYLTGAQNKSGYMSDPQDVINELDFKVRQSEAERLNKTQPYREQIDQSIKKANEMAGIDEFHPEGDPTKVIDLDKWRKNNVNALDAGEKLKNINSKPENSATIVQLSDGRFVPLKSIKGKISNGKWEVANGLDVNTPLYYRLEESPVPSDNKSPADSRTSRDIIVRRELAKDPDFDAVASGRANRQPFYNTAAYAGFNAAAREGTLSDNIGIGMDEKRETALWNRQLDQLRPLVQQGTPEYKRQMVDAIMNVMTFGLDDLPEDMFKANPNAYRAIANQLGSSDWKHRAEVGVADYPTTSYSSAR